MDAADLAERNMELDRARSLGVTARRRDKPVDACPYTDQDERDAWVGGWMAEDMYAAANP